MVMIAGNEGNVAMAQFDQVAGGQPAALEVVEGQ